MTRRRVMLSLLLVLSALLLVSRLVPKVTRLEVTGVHHLSEEEVFAKADLKLNEPLFLGDTPALSGPSPRTPWVAHLEGGAPLARYGLSHGSGARPFRE